MDVYEKNEISRACELEDEYFIYVLTTTVPLAVEKIGYSFYCTFEAEIRTGELYE